MSEPSALRIWLPRPSLFVGVIVLGYGIMGSMLFPLVRHSAASERVTRLNSVDYQQVLGVHFLAAALIAAGGLIANRKMHTTLSVDTQLIVADSVSRFVVLLAWLPLIALVISARNLLVVRADYIPEWPLPLIFKAGSITSSAAAAVSTFVVLLDPVRRRRGSRILVGLLSAYVLVHIAMETREAAVPAALLGGYLFRSKGRRVQIGATVVFVAVAVSVVLSMRSGTVHGLVAMPEGLLKALAGVSRPKTALAANFLNGFHATGAYLASGDGIGPSEVLSSLNPVPTMSSGTRTHYGELEFGFRFPIPTIGLVWQSGTFVFSSFFLYTGFVVERLHRSGIRIAQRASAPKPIRAIGPVVSYPLAGLAGAFIVQYKLFSTTAVLSLCLIAMCVMWIVGVVLSGRSWSQP